MALSDAPGLVDVNDAAVVGGGASETLGELSVWARAEEAQPASRLSVARWATTAVDLTAIGLGLLIAVRGHPPMGVADVLLLLVAYPLAVVWLLGRPLSTWDDGSVIDELRRVVGAASVPALAVIGAHAVVSDDDGVPLGLRVAVCALVLLVVGRVVLRCVRASAPVAASRPLLIVGAGKVGSELARRLREAPQHGLRPLGFLDYGFAPSIEPVEQPPNGKPQGRSKGPSAGISADSLPVLGTPDALPQALAETGAETVAFAFTEQTDERLLPLIEQCEQLRVQAFFIPRLFEATGWRSQVHPVGSLPLVELCPVGPRDVRFALKHGLDRLISALLLLAFAPFMIAIAALVKATSAGPVFFRQQRIGRDGREFTMLKFRSMREPVGTVRSFVPVAGFAPGGVEDEDRRTNVGQWLRRTSLDELPQLINVLRGEMSLIGPRPERPEYVRQFALQLRRYHRRHRVKSGITGLAQVSGLRGQTSIVERAEYDNFYVQNWSFWLDLKIALRTITTVLACKGE